MSSDIDPLYPPDVVAFAGDWHANANWAVSAIHHACTQDVDTIIHTGDFGYRFTKKFLRTVERELSESARTLLFVDGNHEDFPTLHSYPLRGNGLRRITPCIWHIPRGFQWEWHGLRFMGVGGGYSIDRPYRTEGMSWWPQEMITAQQEAEIITGLDQPVHVMISHDCPSGVTIPGLSSSAWQWHPDDLAISAEHRKIVQRITDAAAPGMLVHGHYHRHYRSTLPTPRGICDVIGLDRDDTTMGGNLAIFTIDQLRDALA
jgi:hypothetical protein